MVYMAERAPVFDPFLVSVESAFLLHPTLFDLVCPVGDGSEERDEVLG